MPATGAEQNHAADGSLGVPPLSAGVRRRPTVGGLDMAFPLSLKTLDNQARLARYLAVAVAGIIIALGVAAAVAPGMVIAASQSIVSLTGILVAAALRCGIGVALLFVAGGSRAPAILRIIGALSLVAGLTMPFLGVDNAKARIEWEAEHMMFFRLEGVLFVWAGVIVYRLSQPPPNYALKLTARKARAAAGAKR
jgi:hypothetical protein